MVPRREQVDGPQIEGAELAGEVSPAPRERPGAERRAGVEAAQDEEKEVVGEGTYRV